MVAASAAAAAEFPGRLYHLRARWSTLRRAGRGAGHWHPAGTPAAVFVAPSAVAEALVPCRAPPGLPRDRRLRRPTAAKPAGLAWGANEPREAPGLCVVCHVVASWTGGGSLPELLDKSVARPWPITSLFCATYGISCNLFVGGHKP